MTDLDMTTDVETADFTDELSDEALDREEGMAVYSCGGLCGRPSHVFSDAVLPPSPAAGCAALRRL